jgi:hypothetical protein
LARSLDKHDPHPGAGELRSGIAPYLQIVGQVRQALLLGLLCEGDKLLAPVPVPAS